MSKIESDTEPIFPSRNLKILKLHEEEVKKLSRKPLKSRVEILAVLLY